MPSTPINGLPSPTDASPNDPPIHFDALNAVLDSRLIARFTTTTARDSAITAPIDGMTVWCDSPGAFYDRIAGAWVQRQIGWLAFSPTWTAVNLAPTLGNGTLTGRYHRVGRTITFQITLTIGSTTNAGRGSFNFANLPAVSAAREQRVHATAFAAGGSLWNGFGVIPSGQSYVAPYLPNTSSDNRHAIAQSADSTGTAGTGIPNRAGNFSFVTGENLQVHGAYEAAS